MRIHLVKRQTIEEYVAGHSGSRVFFKEWLGKIKYADWNGPKDIMSTFRTADLLGEGSNRVVFNIGGNHYRMICKYAFGKKEAHLFVCWIGTHAVYDKLCNKGAQYKVNEF